MRIKSKEDESKMIIKEEKKKDEEDKDIKERMR